MAADYGVVWQVSKTVSLEDQVTYSNAHQPGTAEYTGGTDSVLTAGDRADHQQHEFELLRIHD